MPDLLPQFIRSFQKAITEEMHAMRQRMGPFEVLLTNARALDTVENSNGNLFFYTFEVVTQNDKLTLHGECTLTYDGRESLVTITELEKNEVTIRCEKEIHLGASSYTLVIYPWFLYEKLKVVLESLLVANTFHVENALTLFGKIPPLRQAQSLHIAHTEEGGFSRFNENSARLCVDLTMEAIGDGIESVAIITPYVSQSRCIRQILSSYRMSAEQVHCSTVHRFQGNERDLVILDTVDASPLSPGVLLSDSFPRSSARNLINVSLSRARGKLIIIADVSYFGTYSPNDVIDRVLRLAMDYGIRVSSSM